MNLPVLYPILDVSGDSGDREQRRPRALAHLLCQAGCTWLQLRHKNGDSAVTLDLARNLVAELTPLGGRLIVNDRLDIALLAGAAGVHLGQNDLPIAAARQLARPPFVIGVSTHDPEEAAAAEAAGADYIGFGPMFATGSKADALTTPRSLELLAATRRRTRLPIVAIGGINLERAGPILTRGADAVAMISALSRAEAPLVLTRAILALPRAGNFR